jgi:hypothetical protein
MPTKSNHASPTGLSPGVLTAIAASPNYRDGKVYLIDRDCLFVSAFSIDSLIFGIDPTDREIQGL